MALHLITGYAGQEHITSADQGAYNMATFGSGNFVLERGQKFAQNVLTNNAIQISDGEAMIQGRYIMMPKGTNETVTIENGTQGNKRNDLICIRYNKDTSSSIESASFVVIKGTPTTGTPTDPEYINGNITDGTDNVADFPLYRVTLDGINIDSVTSLFNVKTSMVDFMDNYYMPIASKDTKGIMQLGKGLYIRDGKTNNVIIGSEKLFGIKKSISIPAGGYIERTLTELFNLPIYPFQAQAFMVNISQYGTYNPYIRFECVTDYNQVLEETYNTCALPYWKVRIYNSSSSAVTITEGTEFHLSFAGVNY